jgi:hypothetical protein
MLPAALRALPKYDAEVCDGATFDPATPGRPFAAPASQLSAVSPAGANRKMIATPPCCRAAFRSPADPLSHPLGIEKLHEFVAIRVFLKTSSQINRAYRKSAWLLHLRNSRAPDGYLFDPMRVAEPSSDVLMLLPSAEPPATMPITSKPQSSAYSVEEAPCRLAFSDRNSFVICAAPATSCVSGTQADPGRIAREKILPVSAFPMTEIGAAPLPAGHDANGHGK